MRRLLAIFLLTAAGITVTGVQPAHAGAASAACGTAGGTYVSASKSGSGYAECWVGGNNIWI